MINLIVLHLNLYILPSFFVASLCQLTDYRQLFMANLPVMIFF